MKGGIRITEVTTMLHFLVDGLCVCSLYMMVPFFHSAQIMVYIFVYNVLAFMSQPLTGIMVDMLERKDKMLCASVVGLLLAVCAVAVLPYTEGKLLQSVGFVVSVLLGMGNSLFHVWGGKRIVMQVGNEIRHLGVYVSTGALGLSVGLLFHSWLLVCILLSCICLLLVVCFFSPEFPVSSISRKIDSVSFTSEMGFVAWLLIILIMLFVSFRSFFGNVMSSMVAMDDVMVLVVGVVSMLGKMAGGWMAHRWGIVRIMLLLSLLVVACFWMHYGLLGMFVINCTMPITLFWANALLKGREAIAFGLLAFALVPGYYLFYVL